MRAKRGPEAAVARSNDRLERQLAELLADPESAPDRVHQLATLQREASLYLSSRSRKRALRWSLWGVLVAVLASAALSLFRLDRPKFVVDAVTRSVIFGTGAADETLLSGTGPSSIEYQGKDGSFYYCSTDAVTDGCDRVERLALLYLKSNQASNLEIHAGGDCFEVQFLEGGGQLAVQVDGLTPVDVANASPPARHHFQRPGAGATIRYCGAESSILVLREPRFLILGDSEERLVLPAASSGEILLADTGESQEIAPTDVVQLERLSAAQAILQLGEELRVTLAGQVGDLHFIRAGEYRDARPSWLGWVLGSPSLKAWLAILGGIWVAVAALRKNLEVFT